jgi:hypothetical protein
LLKDTDEKEEELLKQIAEREVKIRVLKDTNEKEEELLKQIDEREVKLRVLKDTNEKEEELLKQIDEREAKIRVLKDTSTSRLGDKAFLQTILSMDQPKMTLEDKTVNNSSGHGQNRPSGPTPPKMGTFTGKEDCRPYFLQFCHIANKYELSDQDRLDKRIECLKRSCIKIFYKTKVCVG